MFDIGFFELVLVAVIMLIVLGPERLPVAVKFAARWFVRIRNSFRAVKQEIEQELKLDEIKQDLHNEQILETLKLHDHCEGPHGVTRKSSAGRISETEAVQAGTVHIQSSETQGTKLSGR